MHVGVVLPQTEMEPTLKAVRAYTQRVEELGYAHLLA